MTMTCAHTQRRGGLDRIATALIVVATLLLLGGGLAASSWAQDGEPDRDYWVHRYQTLKADVLEMRTRVDMLETQYVKSKRRNYPRGVELEDLRTALEESQEKLAELEEQWENFEDDARRAGAPPGWFRD